MSVTEEGRPLRPRAPITRDNAFWFEAVKEHRLLIQRCASCGRLRHPPAPMCPACRSFDWDTVQASGRGAVYSYIVNHHPQHGAFDYPLPVAVIELEEGVRLIADLVEVDPSEVKIDMAVEVVFIDHDPDLTLPAFRPV